ncbi:hypothetical protein SY2F82_25680 [Streptomyces sp. Y2F8-2]|uniref:hypothetical protein n=1 Tax=unclassified Streptomyces TaxID=2593676 RepID=UPI001907874A|nr:hypothetical protein [Streptomyces sp. Y2F8-2]GHK00771.1 hypothetical protein SY2F82_25680 [Streptomyces sp. Y2F8-2]
MGASEHDETARTRELAREAVRRLAPDELAFFDEAADAYFENPARTTRKARPEPLGIGIEAIVVSTLTAFALPVAATVAGNIATDVMREERRRGWWRRRRTRADDGTDGDAGGAPDGGPAPDSAGGADNPFAAPGTVRPVALGGGQARPADFQLLQRIAYDRGVALGLPPDQAQLLADAILGAVVGGRGGGASGGDALTGGSRDGEDSPS